MSGPFSTNMQKKPAAAPTSPAAGTKRPVPGPHPAIAAAPSSSAYAAAPSSNVLGGHVRSLGISSAAAAGTKRPAPGPPAAIAAAPSSSAFPAASDGHPAAIHGVTITGHEAKRAHPFLDQGAGAAAIGSLRGRGGGSQEEGDVARDRGQCEGAPRVLGRENVGAFTCCPSSKQTQHSYLTARA